MCLRAAVRFRTNYDTDGAYADLLQAEDALRIRKIDPRPYAHLVELFWRTPAETRKEGLSEPGVREFVFKALKRSGDE